MDGLAFEHHLLSPQGLGRILDGGFTAVAEGGACGDRLRFSLAVDAARVVDAGFAAEACGATRAAASAAVCLVRGRSLLAAARIGAADIASELGGLSPAKLHAAELAADALARALGAAARERARLPATPGGRTLVAMSGGVDSAVAAWRCAQEEEVVAVTLELWADAEHDAGRSCCSASAVAQARRLAHSMGLAHFTLDLRREFRQAVVDPFIAGFAAGATPNPCISCNGRLRLDAMLDLAARLGCRQLATGHYARIGHPPDGQGPLLRAAVDTGKDQTYMLAALDPGSLARMCFPLGKLRKPEVRRLAAEAGLPVAAKADSQDLCFLAGTDRSRFLARHGAIDEREGDIVDRRGRVLGRHGGQHRFTVGQRRGVNVAASQPLYVLHRDGPSNRITVGPRHALLTRQVALRPARLHRPGERVDHVKLRYRSPAHPARLSGPAAAGPHRSLAIELEQPADGAAPGQLACLMEGDLVLGWGTIAAS